MVAANLRRAFPLKWEEARAAIERWTEDIQKFLASLDTRFMFRFGSELVKTTSFDAKFERVYFISANATANLPEPKPSDDGRWIGLVSAGAFTFTINAKPPSLISGAATQSVNTAARLRLIYCDGANYWLHMV